MTNPFFQFTTHELDISIPHPQCHAKCAGRLALAFGAVAGKQGHGGAYDAVLDLAALTLTFESFNHGWGLHLRYYAMRISFRQSINEQDAILIRH